MAPRTIAIQSFQAKTMIDERLRTTDEVLIEDALGKKRARWEA